MKVLIPGEVKIFDPLPWLCGDVVTWTDSKGLFSGNGVTMMAKMRPAHGANRNIFISLFQAMLSILFEGTEFNTHYPV
jgi:hypothetical protein